MVISLTTFFNKKLIDYFTWLAVISIILLTATIRLRLLSIPLDRDEGTYAYIADLLLKGNPPYTQAYATRFPGIYYVYAFFFLLFGQNSLSIHLGLLIANAVSVLLIFLIGKHLFVRWTGIIAGAVYAIITLNPTGLGFSAESEHFVVLLSTSAILVMLIAIDSNRLFHFFLCGILFGLMALLKQNSIIIFLSSMVYIIFVFLKKEILPRKKMATNVLIILAGFIIPITIICIYFIYKDNFGKFFFWTITYVKYHTFGISLIQGLENFLSVLPLVIPSSLLLVYFAMLVGVASFFVDKDIRIHLPFISLFTFGLFLSICTPGLYFRPHYFIVFLPAVAVLSGLGIVFIYKLLAEIKKPASALFVSVVFTIIMLILPLIKERKFLFCMTPDEACRRIYIGNPFPESLKIADYIKKHTTENDRIAIIGSEPQIYFYSDRNSATKYTCIHRVVDTNEVALQMQKELITEIESAKPKYLIFANVITSWFDVSNQSNKPILDWAVNFLEKHYNLDGIIDILSNETPELTVYKWGSEAVNYSPRSNCFLCVFKKK
ncbi:MAG: glycosyltransferase family 39 protein [Elusimicrobiota bacterium]